MKGGCHSSFISPSRKGLAYEATGPCWNILFFKLVLHFSYKGRGHRYSLNQQMLYFLCLHYTRVIILHSAIVYLCTINVTELRFNVSQPLSEPLPLSNKCVICRVGYLHKESTPKPPGFIWLSYVHTHTLTNACFTMHQFKV